ncbi:hypothetical protein CROQUDRAFT_101327 [Cronartium quercuum f. sp. fusiforme G11]|uniref:Uncharacterized protein n=1 Tax=Cronartium quercuum f. sp. fusiforme G11 TaxID=708437 RepID=A0A9P6T581_9BASI|nr:hypothetical protein CROQUDRAFT_101327 [Cronartium quercuum f. sp. fusiforme G11]
MSNDEASLSRMDWWKRADGLKTDPIKGELRVQWVEVHPEELGSKNYSDKAVRGVLGQ